MRSPGAQPGRASSPRPSAGQLARPASCAGSPSTVGRSVRGRVLIVDARGRVLADTDGEDAARRVVRDAGRRSPPALRGRHVQDERHSDTLDEDDPRDRRADPRRAAGPRAPCASPRASRRSAAPTRSSILGLIAIGGLVLLIGLAAGVLIARPDRAARCAASTRRPRAIADGDLVRRAPVEGTDEQRSLAQHVQRDDRAAASAWSPASASSSPTPRTSCARRSAACGCASRRRARRRVDPRRGGDRRRARRGRPAVRDGRRAAAALAGRRARRARRAGRPRRRRPPARATRCDERGAPRRAARRPPPVRCAPADLERALDALVENALHYGGGDASTLVAAPGRDRRARRRARASSPASTSRSSSASTAAARAARGRAAAGSACRSRAR